MAIGIVRGLIGKVTVTDAKGSVRELRVGDAVELNDNVQASAGGTVHIVFNNGNFATVGSHDTLILSEAVIDPTGAKAQVAEGQSVADHPGHDRSRYGPDADRRSDCCRS